MAAREETYRDYRPFFTHLPESELDAAETELDQIAGPKAIEEIARSST